jgi:hypothetical protein
MGIVDPLGFPVSNAYKLMETFREKPDEKWKLAGPISRRFSRCFHWLREKAASQWETKRPAWPIGHCVSISMRNFLSIASKGCNLFKQNRKLKKQH